MVAFLAAMEYEMEIFELAGHRIVVYTVGPRKNIYQ